MATPVTPVDVTANLISAVVVLLVISITINLIMLLRREVGG